MKPSLALLVVGYLMHTSTVVQEVKSAPFGFGLLCDTYEDLLCELFGSCDYDEYYDSDEDIPIPGPPPVPPQNGDSTVAPSPPPAPPETSSTTAATNGQMDTPAP
ncbi:uncharacterized protein LOC143190710 [Rhynchophorus ferrugineus]|uniref:uncharacterized protein LOC143190710 n=1 Tax=Rhynchophorus ferrugineus TaxID=354439 RepID=UPI003FCD7A11